MQQSDQTYQWLQQLGAAADKYATICSIYLTARLIIASSASGDYAEALRSEAKLQKQLQIYRQVVSPLTGPEYADVWEALCRSLVSTGMADDYKAFFVKYAPGAVQDWGRLATCGKKRISNMLILMTIALRDPPPPELEVPNDAHRRTYAAYAAVLELCGIRYDTYRRAWQAVHLTYLGDRTHRPNGNIANAIAVYRSLYLPMSDLLTDYAHMHLSSDRASAMWAKRGDRRSRKASNDMEHTRSEKDKQLERAMERIADERPTDMIRELYYSAARNDAQIECDVVMSAFFNMVSLGCRVLIVNPSPDMLETWQAHDALVKDICMAVKDSVVAQLYASQYPDVRFEIIEDVSNGTVQYDRILLTVRNSDPTDILRTLRSATKDAQILGLLPERTLTGGGSKLVEKLGDYRIHRIVSIPTNLVQSHPKRKMMVWADVQTSRNFQLQFGVSNDPKTIFTILKCNYLIPQKWLEGTMTLADMRKAAIAQTAPKTKEVNSPRLHSWSAEVKISYSIQQDCKNRVAGRICYRQILRPEQLHRKRGNVLTPIIEKGLRKKSEAEVVDAIEFAVLDERIAPYVVEDVLDYYKGRLHQLSIKTAWLCLRDQLRTKSTYNEAVVEELLLGKDQGLAALIIGDSVPEDYEREMDKRFPDGAPKRYWDQLNMLLAAAAREGMIRHNSLAGHMRLISGRISERQRRSRNTLTKKTFEADEECKIMEKVQAWIGEDDGDGNGSWLAAVIKMYTGMDLREICALRWADFLPIADTDYWQLRVTQYLVKDGVAHPVIDRAPERHRCVPVAGVLARILQDYKQRLMETYGLTDDEIGLCPMVLERKTALRNGPITKFCRLKTAADRCRELIASTEIESHRISLPDDTYGDLTADLNSYVGDLLYTNVKFHLINDCGFSLGEMSYFLGLKAPNTYAKHYCNHGNPVLQFIMAKKLSRWTARYLPDLTVAQSYYQHLVAGQQWELMFSSGAQRMAVDVSVTPVENHVLNDLSIEITSRHGVTGNIICYEEGEVDDT